MQMNENFNVNECSPLALAFMGDCVYDVLVRKKLILEGNRPAKDLHNLSSELVCCKGQVRALKKISDNLTTDEMNIFKRGRNAKNNHSSKSGTIAEYHTATGFEALLGYLYLDNQHQRILELFEMIFNEGGDIK